MRAKFSRRGDQSLWITWGAFLSTKTCIFSARMHRRTQNFSLGGGRVWPWGYI